MAKEIFINPEETPAEAEYAESLRNWGRVHPAYLRSEVSKELNDAAWDRRKAAEDALDRERVAMKNS